ncbi:wax ester/triacylglycerol synthase family O-acyltransferase [Haliea sp. E1-2-M8]|uniref:WS/DGAT/MGAT family O-acyltransferase n=1 Tax=Haliea sp. E1-2-M8 TaxID=3064706 RepID=UPI0027275BBF|nr:wax ester/triacylglycerol synthase family O-acyltransferase [Haliea sp. E1-2-M8]MDO8860699.1 wax ester/triacylglycerol synthase family O-acyltransferase [Haliea sp. E1-2-M8]
MKQLGILDSAFINMEQPNTPQHVGSLGIYDPSTAPGGKVRFKQVIATFERRLAKQPLFRTRLVRVPGGLDRPYWVKDARFDVEFHLRHIALPKPGDWRQLCIQVARLHSRPLDMGRPLWEAWIIEGLDRIPGLPAGSFAIYTKIHHSLVDGMAGSSIVALIHDLVADPQAAAAEDEPPKLVDPQPSIAELLARASINGIRNVTGVVSGGISTSAQLARYLTAILRKQVPPPDISAPKTRFNRSVGPHRVFTAAEFTLERVQAVKDAAGVKVNDVALAITGGALLRYLAELDEVPAAALAATIPLNMRTRRDSSDDNNQVGSVFTSLHTDIADPAQRLQAIHLSAVAAQRSGDNSPIVDVVKLAGVFAPALTRPVLGFWARNHLSSYLPVNVSTVVSNVAGPDFPLYCAGARLVDYYGLGVLTPGLGIFHMFFSYCGKVTISVLADREMLPQPERYQACLESAFEELEAAFLPRPARRRRQKKPAKRRV